MKKKKSTDIRPRSHSKPGVKTRGMKRNKNRRFKKKDEKEKESGTLKHIENMEAMLNSITPVLMVDEYVDNTLVNMVEVEMNTSTSSSGSEKENKKAKTGEEEENETRIELDPKNF